MNLTNDRAAADKRMLPPAIQAALTQRSLLFIGYGLQDWTFRFMFMRLTKAVPGINLRRHVSVQLPPGPADSPASHDITEQLERYYAEWRISVFWGTAEEFFQQLQARLEGQ